MPESTHHQASRLLAAALVSLALGGCGESESDVAREPAPANTPADSAAANAGAGDMAITGMEDDLTGSAGTAGGELAQGDGDAEDTGSAMGAVDDTASDDDDNPVTVPGVWSARPLDPGPTYMGSGGGSSGCNNPAATLGFEPDDDSGNAYPLFLYFVGTTFSSSDLSARYDSEAAKAVTEAMARRGFVALSVHYDNTLSLSFDKVTCLYDSPESVVATACALPQVDCDLGIATWGHSQGALMAHIASQFEPRVRAVWTTGYSGGNYPLPDDRLRVVNGEADLMNGNWNTIRSAAGFGSSECPDDGSAQCLRPDGSGFIIVRAQDCVVSTADHCWFDRRACSDNDIMLEPNWTDMDSTLPFALELNADWVAQTVARP